MMMMAVRRLKSSSSSGLDTRFFHWIPTPCSSNRAKYSQPNPNATGDRRLCRARGGHVTRPITSQQQNREKDAQPYSEDFRPEADVLFPGNAEHVWQVEGEVDDSSTGGGEVGTGKCRAEQEALHDGHHTEGPQEEEDDAGVAVGQEVPHLHRNHEKKRWDIINIAFLEMCMCGCSVFLMTLFSMYFGF